MIENEKYLRAYFGTGADYYLEKYKAFHEGQLFKFNFFPFLLGGLWFLYRKLWLESIIVVLVMVLLGMLEDRLYPVLHITKDVQKGIVLGSTLVLGVLYGFVGNYCYITKADKTVDQILKLTSDENERMSLLSQIGGISWMPFILVGVIAALAVFGSR